MKLISSRSTFFRKRIFPIMWFGFLAVFVVMLLVGPLQKANIPLPALFFPFLMAGFGYFIMKKLVFDLADEVFDGGNFLVVRFGAEQENIPLADIINVSYTMMVNPPRVTLTLRSPGRFGKEVSFSPQRSSWSFSKSPIIQELIERIDVARRKK